MKKPNRYVRLTAALIAGACMTPIAAHAQWSTIAGQPAPSKVSYLVENFSKEEWESSNFASPKDIARFQDWRFGLMISFSPSTWSKAEMSWGTVPADQRKAPDGTNLSDGFTYPKADWANWDQKMILEKFDAKQWVAFAKAAGFRYIVVIAKHHDGFHLWDTAVSNYKITRTPFGRDYLKEVIDACHEAGMPIGIYYSQRDWYRPDYQPTGFGPNGNEAGPFHNDYIDYQKRAVSELLTKYGKIDLFWFDAVWWGGMFSKENWDSEALTRMIRKLQPGILINNRASLPGDFDTPEQRMGVFQTKRAWEAAVSYEDTWSYSGTKPKSEEQVISLLVNTAINDGNLLLSLGPQWSGAFEPGEMATMKRVGAWLAANGETIYNTRGGPWKPHKWGGSTWRGSTAFLHLAHPSNEPVVLKSIPGISVRKATVHVPRADGKGTEAKVIAVSQKAGQISFTLPAGLQSPLDTVVRLDMSRSLAGVAPIDPLPNQGLAGNTNLSPFDYELVYGHRLQSGVAISASSLAKPLTEADITALLAEHTPAGFQIATNPDGESWVDITFPRASMVSGLLLDTGSSQGTVEVSLSRDGTNFEPIWRSEKSEPGTRHEIEVNDFKAGARTPGRSTRIVRIRMVDPASRALVLRQLGIWSLGSQ